MVRITRNDAQWLRDNNLGYAVQKAANCSSYYIVEEPDEKVWDKKLKKMVVIKEGALSIFEKHKKNCVIASTETK